jgi:cellulose biosynthesis protein BcsQ
MSQIITFYSYKGGVGRSMALANVATLLSKWGKKVLMIDWDLEAPGLENFFREYLQDTDWKQQKGVLEWLYAQQNHEEVKWQDWVVRFKTKDSKTDLHLLVSGKDNGNYSEMLRDFDVSQFYEKHDGGQRIEAFRKELLKNYDYVLIDSRTGVTDFGGICTIQMPDILVMLFAPTEQGLSGTKKIAQRILDGHSKLPFDRFNLLICPVPSRFDSTTEFQESRKWLDRISSELEELYESWLPGDVNLNEFLQIIKIPYISYFSFGEKLPVIEQGVSDPTGLGYAYENLAMILGRGLDEVEEFIEKREKYLEEVSGQKPVYIDVSEGLGDRIRRVKIFVSFQKNDKRLIDKLINGIQSLFPHNKIDLLNKDGISIGQSKSNFIKSKVEMADIILVMISRNYLPSEDVRTRVYKLAPDVTDEFNAISTLKEGDGVVVPVYFNFAPKSMDKIPQFLSDRIGIDIRNSNSQDLIIDSVVNNIAPIIESIILEKSKPINLAL